MFISKIKRQFTKWYIKRGYTFNYDFTGIPAIGDDILKVPMGIPKVVFNCPFWVRPLLIFFSPSYYIVETYGKIIIKGFREGLEKGSKENLAATKLADSIK